MPTQETGTTNTYWVAKMFEFQVTPFMCSILCLIMVFPVYTLLFSISIMMTKDPVKSHIVDFVEWAIIMLMCVAMYSCALASVFGPMEATGAPVYVAVSWILYITSTSTAWYKLSKHKGYAQAYYGNEGGELITKLSKMSVVPSVLVLIAMTVTLVLATELSKLITNMV